MVETAIAGATLAAGVWVGAIIFQVLVVAPSVFDALDETSARRFLRTVFPRFYLLGLICGAVLFPTLLLAGVLLGMHMLIGTHSARLRRGSPSGVLA